MILECIILDRDLTYIQTLKKFEDFLPFLRIKGCFTDADLAISFLQEHPVDILFVDHGFVQNNSIQSKDLNLDHTEIILSLTNPSFEFKTHSLSIFDYILKPISLEKLIKPLSRLYHRKLNEENNLAENRSLRKNDFFFVKNNSIIERVNFDDVLFFKGLKDYIWIQTKAKKIITLHTMKNLCENLPTNQFVRIHKSYIVALEHIDFIDRNKVIIGNERIPIGDTYKASFFDQLKEMELLWC